MIMASYGPVVLIRPSAEIFPGSLSVSMVRFSTAVSPGVSTRVPQLVAMKTRDTEVREMTAFLITVGKC